MSCISGITDPAKWLPILPPESDEAFRAALAKVGDPYPGIEGRIASGTPRPAH